MKPPAKRTNRVSSSSCCADNRQASRKEARRAQVLDAASKCFVSDGFHNAGMSSIAREAGMSVGHIYHYFENKDAIIAAIVERDMQSHIERFDQFGLIPKENFVEKLIEEAGDGIRMKTDVFNSALNLEILAECRRSPSISRLVREKDAEIRNRFSQIIQEKTGLDDAPMRVEILFTLFGGLTERITRNPDLDPDDLLPYLQSAIHAILKPH